MISSAIYIYTYTIKCIRNLNCGWSAAVRSAKKYAKDLSL